MGGCEQLFSAGVASPLSKTATVFSRTITWLASRCYRSFSEVYGGSNLYGGLWDHVAGKLAVEKIVWAAVYRKVVVYYPRLC